MPKSDLKQKIRPIYSELQGYLSQAPNADKPEATIGDKSLWEQYNRTVGEFSQISGKDYRNFLIEPIQGSYKQFIRINTYRQKLGGIISRIHGEFFSDEPAPFSGMPSTVITQTQQQNQSIQIYLDIQSKIDEAIPNFEDGSREKGFLEKFKNSLSTASNVNELFKLCFKFRAPDLSQFQMQHKELRKSFSITSAGSKMLLRS